MVAAQLRPKNLVPLAHVEHGWAFGDSLAIFGDDVNGVVQVPLDELERYVAMPYAVAITPDKQKLYVSKFGIGNSNRYRHPKDVGVRTRDESAVYQRPFRVGQLRGRREFRLAVIRRALCFPATEPGSSWPIG